MWQRLDDLPLRGKLLMAPAVCAVLIAASAAVALWGFSQQRAALDTVMQQRMPAYVFSARFEAGLRDVNGLINRSLGMEAMGFKPDEVAKIDEALVKNMATLRQLLTDQKQATSLDEAVLAALEKGYGGYEKAVKDTLEVKVAGAAVAASFLTTAQQFYEPLLKDISAVSQAKLDSAGHDVAEARSAAVRAQFVVATSGVAAVALSLLLSALVARGLLRRTGVLSARVGALAAGDLGQPVAAEGADEVGRLMGDFERVRQQLASAMRAVAAASESVRVAAGEIASGNNDLSQRTERQADSLQQTAASVEQLHQGVQHSADSARQANQLASQASQVAASGGEIVNQVVATMGEITASSRRISEIIATIDGIAFQTNILALNAAVEAARAGEQGRGFAVVAGEVRTLAQRSATASKEIRSLISGSVERVEQGSRLVAEAGTTMRDIVMQVQRVSQLIGEIDGATATQSSQIVEVRRAVTHLDEVTQQNAALVEESASAADSLSQQATRLVETVGVFRLAST